MATSDQEHADSLKFFDRLAENWDSDEQNPDQTVKRVSDILELLKLQSGDDLLEVGCGTGQLSDWLAQQVSPGRVTAIDFSEKMLAAAKSKYDKAQHQQIEFRRIDVCRDALEPSRFDVAFCFHCVPHFIDMPAAINNLAHSLKPGGRLLVVHLNSRKGINDFHDSVGGAVAGHHLPDADGWDNLLTASGLKKTMLIDREGLYLLEATKCGS